MVGAHWVAREICLAIDPYGANRGSLHSAMLLAEKLKAGIYGLLVANERLHQVAQLPFTTEVLVCSGDEREFCAANLELMQRQKLVAIRAAIAELARQRQVAVRLEEAVSHFSLQLLLTHQDVLLPSARKVDKPKTLGRGESLQMVKWVYEASPAGERSFALLKELVVSGLTRRVFFWGSSAVPQAHLNELTSAGAKVYWVNVGAGGDMLAQLRQPPAADLLLLPASLLDHIDEQALLAFGLAYGAPVLLVNYCPE